MSRARCSLLWILALTGCQSGDGGKVTDEGPTDDLGDTDTETTDTDVDDTDTATDTGPTDTGTSRDYARPSVLEVVCDPTANALRFQCTVTVDPAQPVELTFVRNDGLSATRTADSDEELTEHVLPLYFMAPNQDYDVEVWATAWPEDVIATSVTTTAPPQGVNSVLSMTGASSIGMIGSHLPCDSDATAVVYDTQTGDLLWYEQMDPGGSFGSLDMVQFTEDLTVLGESSGDVIEVDLMGTDIIRLNDLDTALGVNVGGAFGNFHHDIMKRNGLYYVVYQEEYGGSGFFADILDTLIVFDGTGAEIARWYPIDHLALPGNWSGDYLHTNTIWVDELGDIYLSWLTQDTVGKIDGDVTSGSFGTPIWMLRGGTQGSLGSSFAIDWSGVGSPANFNDQHSVSTRPDGRLEMLDNRNGRGLVLTLDEVNGTATVDAEYATRENSCGPQGTARSTLGGNSLVGCAGDWLREYDVTTGSVIWEAEVQCAAGGFAQGSSRWYPLEGW